MSLTRVQQRLLDNLRAGRSSLVRHFDVWAGYWYEERPCGARPRDATVRALMDGGHLRASESQRVFSGRQITYYFVNTPSPRKEGDDG